jgi:pimeloyl-ACP methyl ester carboxylesterase
MATTAAKTGYAPVNGLRMYYEIHGTGPPLVLLHGGVSAIGTSFGSILPGLAASRQVIAVEQQGHGRTADIDRPLNMEQMAKDTVELLRHLSVESADFLGYSLGAGVAMYIALQHPEFVRKLVLISLATNPEGYHPGLLEGMEQLTPEALAGSPFAEEYAQLAPNPENWPTLIEKTKQLDREFQGVPNEAVQSITAPALLVFGDSDIVRPEHAVELFRSLGGGVMGDVAGLPRSRLAVLPASTHITVMYRGDWLVSMVTEFLEAPMPERG